MTEKNIEATGEQASPEKIKETPKLKPGQIAIDLARPLETHEGKIKTLVLDEPSARLVLEYGPPFKAIVGNKDGKQTLDFEFNPQLMGLYIEEMSGIDLETLGTMKGSDMLKCFNAVMRTMNAAGN